jgi:hypothetical protein
VAEHGADMLVPVSLRTIVTDCPRMQAAQVHDVCGVHLPAPALAGQHLRLSISTNSASSSHAPPLRNPATA